MSKTKTREITIVQSKGAFSIFKKSGTSKSNYDFEGLSVIRKVLSNEKARILHVIKTKNPESIYDLAKKLKRSFKSVNEEVKLLERVGFIQLTREKTKKRIRHKPEILTQTITININI